MLKQETEKKKKKQKLNDYYNWPKNVWIFFLLENNFIIKMMSNKR